MEFKCPKCGSTNLYLVREETTATELTLPNDDTEDFDYGRESVVDCDVSEVQCGEDHSLVLQSGEVVSDFKEFKTWFEEQK